MGKSSGSLAPSPQCQSEHSFFKRMYEQERELRAEQRRLRREKDEGRKMAMAKSAGSFATTSSRCKSDIAGSVVLHDLRGAKDRSLEIMDSRECSDHDDDSAPAHCRPAAKRSVSCQELANLPTGYFGVIAGGVPQTGAGDEQIGTGVQAKGGGTEESGAGEVELHDEELQRVKYLLALNDMKQSCEGSEVRKGPSIKEARRPPKTDDPVLSKCASDVPLCLFAWHFPSPAMS